MNSSIRVTIFCCACSLAGMLAASPSHADVVISTDASQNMTCSGGVCAPTSNSAVLNVGDLEAMLAAGNVTVVTINSGVQANNIVVTAPFSWTAASSLTLDAYQSITVTGAVKNDGAGGVSLITNDGGSGGALSFFRQGHLSFKNLKDSLSINGTRYKLEKTIKGLARAIVANPNGAFALADNYDAKPDGLYRTIPIPVLFGGQFNGLGHVISKVEIGDTADVYVGFFWVLYAPGTISSLGLKDIVVDTANSTNSATGGLVGEMIGGNVSNSWTSGKVIGTYDAVGGLVGYDAGGTVSNSWSSAQVINLNEVGTGGLVGLLDSGGVISSSFATGSVSNYSCVGGLAGGPWGAIATITNSYATGPISGTINSYDSVGGLIGCANAYSITSSYSTGLVTGAPGATVGGFIGSNSNYRGSTTATNCYWDTTTSGTNVGLGGGDPITGSITGLTTSQLQSGLPAGFDPTIWAENPNINNGLPYLIANPPPQ